MAGRSSIDRRVEEFRVPFQADAAGAVDKAVWIADRACRLLSVKGVHSTVGGASAAVRPRKVTGASAPGAAASGTVLELTTAFDLTAAVNTVVTKAVTDANARFAPDDRLALDFSGTVTGLVGLVLVFTFEPL